MLYTNSSWEKIHTGVFKNGNQIISHQLAFFASSGPLFLGGFFIFFAAVHTGIQYFNHVLSWKNLQSLDIILFATAIFGGWLITKGRAGLEVRKEHGGIHPNDTLIVLDSTTQDVMKQKGMTEERIGTFANMQLSIRMDRSGKNVKYRIEAIFPEKKERIATTNNRTHAEKLLQEIKSHLHIS
ncbi:MAG: hypothetical protein AAB448_00745 [Patescibacteria group bacterium]